MSERSKVDLPNARVQKFCDDPDPRKEVLAGLRPPLTDIDYDPRICAEWDLIWAEACTGTTMKPEESIS
ncbi:MAG: hypothetical protein MMC23_008623, partial [Stictis urceolatum]|nr:hypothetical protein [Stictis urceolata]